MKFTVEVNSDNAALVDDPQGQLTRILNAIPARLESGHTWGICWDDNGNNVGVWKLHG